MKALVFILLFTSGLAYAQTPAPLMLAFGVKDSTTYLSVANAASTYATIASSAVITQIYTSGTSVTINNTTTWLLINPASTVATLIITSPASPFDGQRVDISFGGTITSGVVISLISLAANSGQTLLQYTSPDVVNAGEKIAIRYNLSQKIWYRL